MGTTFGPLIDRYGRRIDYLRISLTELCNFRCVYCTPSEGLRLQPPSQYLTRSEIARFVRLAGLLGVHRVRLTGGEPLLREDIVEMVRSLKAIETVHDLSITTNASRLSGFVQPLKEAGLDRINISLDSLDRERFRQVTLTDAHADVLKAVDLALEAGFPVKLNMVVLRGLSAKEIVAFVALAMRHPLEIRFLEFMPLCGSAWQENLFLPIRQVRSVVEEHFDLEEMPRADQVAQSFRIRGGRGKVGFIGSLTESFCDRCSRMRLTADGRIRPCLFSEEEVPLKELLRSGAPDAEILAAIRHAAWIKTRGNAYRENPFAFNGDRSRGSSPKGAMPGPAIRTIGG